MIQSRESRSALRRNRALDYNYGDDYVGEHYEQQLQTDPTNSTRRQRGSGMRRSRSDDEFSAPSRDSSVDSFHNSSEWGMNDHKVPLAGGEGSTSNRSGRMQRRSSLTNINKSKAKPKKHNPFNNPFLELPQKQPKQQPITPSTSRRKMGRRSSLGDSTSSFDDPLSQSQRPKIAELGQTPSTSRRKMGRRSSMGDSTSSFDDPLSQSERPSLMGKLTRRGSMDNTTNKTPSTSRRKMGRRSSLGDSTSSFDDPLSQSERPSLMGKLRRRGSLDNTTGTKSNETLHSSLSWGHRSLELDMNTSFNASSSGLPTNFTSRSERMARRGSMNDADTTQPLSQPLEPQKPARSSMRIGRRGSMNDSASSFSMQSEYQEGVEAVQLQPKLKPAMLSWPAAPPSSAVPLKSAMKSTRRGSMNDSASSFSMQSEQEEIQAVQLQPKLKPAMLSWPAATPSSSVPLKSAMKSSRRGSMNDSASSFSMQSEQEEIQAVQLQPKLKPAMLSWPAAPPSTSVPLKSAMKSSRRGSMNDSSSSFSVQPLEPSVSSVPLKSSMKASRRGSMNDSSSSFTVQPLEPSTTSVPLKSSMRASRRGSMNDSSSSFTVQPLEPSVSSVPLKSSMKASRRGSMNDSSSSFTVQPLEASVSSVPLKSSMKASRRGSMNDSSSSFTVQPLEASVSSVPLKSSMKTSRRGSMNDSASSFGASSLMNENVGSGSTSDLPQMAPRGILRRGSMSGVGTEPSSTELPYRVVPTKMGRMEALNDAPKTPSLHDSASISYRKSSLKSSLSDGPMSALKDTLTPLNSSIRSSRMASLNDVSGPPLSEGVMGMGEGYCVPLKSMSQRNARSSVTSLRGKEVEQSPLSKSERTRRSHRSPRPGSNYYGDRPNLNGSLTGMASSLSSIHTDEFDTYNDSMISHLGGRGSNRTNRSSHSVESGSDDSVTTFDTADDDDHSLNLDEMESSTRSGGISKEIGIVSFEKSWSVDSLAADLSVTDSFAASTLFPDRSQRSRTSINIPQGAMDAVGNSSFSIRDESLNLVRMEGNDWNDDGDLPEEEASKRSKRGSLHVNELVARPMKRISSLAFNDGDSYGFGHSASSMGFDNSASSIGLDKSTKSITWEDESHLGTSHKKHSRRSSLTWDEDSIGPGHSSKKSLSWEDNSLVPPGQTRLSNLEVDDGSEDDIDMYRDPTAYMMAGMNQDDDSDSSLGDFVTSSAKQDSDSEGSMGDFAEASVKEDSDTSMGDFVTSAAKQDSDGSLGDFVTSTAKQDSDGSLGDFVTSVAKQDDDDDSMGDFVTSVAKQDSEGSMGDFVTSVAKQDSEGSMGDFVTSAAKQDSEGSMGDFVASAAKQVSDSSMGDFVQAATPQKKFARLKENHDHGPLGPKRASFARLNDSDGSLGDFVSSAGPQRASYARLNDSDGSLGDFVASQGSRKMKSCFKEGSSRSFNYTGSTDSDDESDGIIRDDELFVDALSHRAESSTPAGFNQTRSPRGRSDYTMGLSGKGDIPEMERSTKSLTGGRRRSISSIPASAMNVSTDSFEITAEELGIYDHAEKKNLKLALMKGNDSYGSGSFMSCSSDSDEYASSDEFYDTDEEKEKRVKEGLLWGLGTMAVGAVVGWAVKLFRRVTEDEDIDIFDVETVGDELAKSLHNSVLDESVHMGSEHLWGWASMGDGGASAELVLSALHLPGTETAIISAATGTAAPTASGAAGAAAVATANTMAVTAAGNVGAIAVTTTAAIGNSAIATGAGIGISGAVSSGGGAAGGATAGGLSAALGLSGSGGSTAAVMGSTIGALAVAGTTYYAYGGAAVLGPIAYAAASDCLHDNPDVQIGKVDVILDVSGLKGTQETWGWMPFSDGEGLHNTTSDIMRDVWEELFANTYNSITNDGCSELFERRAYETNLTATEIDASGTFLTTQWSVEVSCWESCPSEDPLFGADLRRMLGLDTEAPTLMPGFNGTLATDGYVESNITKVLISELDFRSLLETSIREYSLGVGWGKAREEIHEERLDLGNGAFVMIPDSLEESPAETPSKPLDSGQIDEFGFAAADEFGFAAAGLQSSESPDNLSPSAAPAQRPTISLMHNTVRLPKNPI